MFASLEVIFVFKKDMSVLNEGDIKAAVIDRLFSTDALNDAVLINEMVVANWSRRADLVLANGKLHAFEVKSDLDSLRRLEGQLKTYLHRFDKVTVVCTEKFVPIVKDCTDQRVEIWCAAPSAEGVAISVARRGTSALVTNKRVLCAYLLKGELVALLNAKSLSVNVEMPRSELETLAETLSIKSIRACVLFALKKRYHSTFELFCRSRSSNTKPNDLINLSKLKSRPSFTPDFHRVTDALPKNIASLDLIQLAKKFGPLPSDMPAFVRKRA